MNKISCSVTILTFNSAKTLRPCLESVKDFDDIVVLDGGSTDGTLDIAREYGAHIFSQREDGATGKISNFTEVREKSLNLAKNNWVFYIDSDEYLSDELRNEIAAAVRENDPRNVYYFNRLAIVDGKIVKHAFFYPEYTLRLINKNGGAHFKEGAVVHESFILAPETKEMRLRSPFYALWPSYEEVVAKDDYYLSLVEKKFEMQARDFSWLKYFRSTLINLVKALNCLRKICLTYLRYGARDTMPFKYQMRFVRYHLLMAFSARKFKLMLRKYD